MLLSKSEAVNLKLVIILDKPSLEGRDFSYKPSFLDFLWDYLENSYKFSFVDNSFLWDFRNGPLYIAMQEPIAQ